MSAAGEALVYITTAGNDLDTSSTVEVDQSNVVFFHDLHQGLPEEDNTLIDSQLVSVCKIYLLHKF